MKPYSHLEKGDLTRQLIAAGHLSGNNLDACDDIVMEQSPVNFTTRLIELKGGLTGVIVDLTIGNPPSGRPIHLDLQNFRIEIPWCQVNWLEKAEPLIIERERPEKTPAPKLYFLPGDPTLSFAKNEVLNHRLSRRCVLLPGNELVGPLMGVGERPVPNEFHDRQRFTTCLSAYYERGKRCDLQVDFIVEREPKRGQGTTIARLTRQRLLEQERKARFVHDSLGQPGRPGKAAQTSQPVGRRAHHGMYASASVSRRNRLRAKEADYKTNSVSPLRSGS